MSMHVRDEGDGPAVLLLHAFPCTGDMWDRQAADLVAAGWRVLVPDLPGFGRSPLPAEEPSIALVAEQVAAVLEERGIDRCVVGGVSLGGYVTMALLRRRLDLVAGVMLCDTKATADAPAARENRERIASLSLAAPADCGRLLEQAMLPSLLGDSTRQGRPEVVARVVGWLHAADPAAVAWYQRAMALRPDSLSVLGSAHVPALVVWGEEDTLSPREEQDLMVEAVEDADLVVIAGAGHLANVEAPEPVNVAMRRFLEVVRGPRTS
jgi:pimeloyl-ACP methyl ester carboxylesterase